MSLSFFLLLLLILTKSSTASDNELRGELRFIYQEIGSLRSENEKQNMEITSLKEIVQLQNNTVNQHEATINELITEDLSVSSSEITRRKRPARLLPYSILFGTLKNDTGNQNRKQFYGPPTNCSDLSRLGYTLNGFYLVKNSLTGASFPQATTIETVYCAFKQEGTYNPFLVQQEVMPQHSAFTSSTILKQDQNISKTTKAKGNGNSYSVGMGHFLINGFGKGVSSYGSKNESFYTLHQKPADSALWSWNETSLGSGDRHLCNHFKKCATSYKIDPKKPNEPSFIRQEDPKDIEGQRFDFLELPAYPGFFLINDEFGKCVGIYGNTDRGNAEVRAIDCNPSEAGQRWKWSYP